jgi:hypothetical protein
VIKLILSALWICVIALASSYVAASWKSQAALVATGDDALSGLNYTKTLPINVPMILGGEIKGYVVARFVYTADAAVQKSLSVPPDVFILDEAFRTIFSDKRIDFEHLEKFDLALLTKNLRESANARFGTDLIQDVLIDQFTFVTKDEVRAQAGVSDEVPVVAADKAIAGEKEETSEGHAAPSGH